MSERTSKPPGTSLRVEALHAQRQGVPCLTGIDFTAAPGQVTVLIGENGAGKSTLLDAIVGMVPPSAGRIVLANEDLATLGPRERARRIASCGQTIPGPWDHSALARIAQGLVPRRGVGRLIDEVAHAEVAAISAELALNGLLDRPMHSLSGGERRRVHVARALVDRESPVYVLDEPFAGVDLRHRDAIAQSLRRRAEAGHVVIVSVHELDWVFRLADRVVALRGGMQVAEGRPEDVLHDDTLYPVFGVHGRLIDVGAGERALVLRGPDRPPGGSP